MRSNINNYIQTNGFEAFCPKAVLFDMDGVLYNSMPNHAVAWEESMKKFGINMTASDAYATEGARGIDTIRLFVKKQKGIDISLEEAQMMYDEKTRIFHSMPEAPIFERECCYRQWSAPTYNTPAQRFWQVSRRDSHHNSIRCETWKAKSRSVSCRTTESRKSKAMGRNRC